MSGSGDVAASEVCFAGILMEAKSYDAFNLVILGVTACLGTLPGSEASYEVAFSTDSVRTIDGLKKGRMRAAKGGPNVFSGLCFCLSDYMNPDNRDCLSWRNSRLLSLAGAKSVFRTVFLP